MRMIIICEMKYPVPLEPLPRAATQNGRLTPVAIKVEPALPSEQLLRGKKKVDILHNGNIYQLQATKLGKLILTKDALP